MNKLTLLALLLYISSFAQSKQEIKEAKERREKYLFATEATPKKFRTTVVGEYMLDEMLIPVTINGKTYHFIFDTGAVTVVSPELAAALGLQQVTSNEIIDAAGVKTQEKIFMIDAVELPGVTFSKVSCASMSMDAFSTALCSRVDGLLGTNIMRLGNCKIDYNNHTVTLSTDKIKPDFEYDIVDFEHNFSDSPIVYLIAGDTRFPALIDSGNNRSVDVPDTIYKMMKFPKTSFTRKSHGRSSFALSGNSDQTEMAVRADSLYFGDILLRRQRLHISPSSQILIGNKFLKQFGQVIISWDKSKIYVPKQTVPQETEYDFGFTPFIENGKMVVVEIWEGSGAQEKGIAINDVILKINDLDVSIMTAELWCEFLQKTKNLKSVGVEILKPDGNRKFIELNRFELLKP